MNLKEFKAYIESFPKGTEFNYGISEPFVWRGIYREVAFEILEEKTTKENILKNINLAYTGVFTAYKGGEYTYNDYTEVHFEEDYSSWTDGRYVANWISKIENDKTYSDNEERFVKKAFVAE